MNILTFDIEDWYNHDDYTQDFEWEKFEVRIYEGVDKILEALSDTGQKGTFMCVGWIGEHHPSIIKKIVDAGHHIGCHSYQHQLATRFSEKEFKDDTYKAKCILEDVCGHEVNAYRVPSFSITKNNLWCFNTLAELGFKYDASVFPSQHEFGGLPDFPAEPTIIKTQSGMIKEFPVNLGKILGREIVYSGGGYFRIMPFKVIKHLMSKEKYVMSYFHPSDFDPNQPKMPQLSLMRQFKNRVALKGAYSKFKKFIDYYDFRDIEEADKILDWNKAPKIDLRHYISKM